MRHVLSVQGVWPYLIAIFLNAFIDLGHKVVIQNTLFKSVEGSAQIVLTALLNALILLPFIVLFMPAGFAASAFARVRVLRAFGWLALGVSLAITAAYYAGLFWLALTLTLLLAVQSTFYSAAKYALIKGLFGKQRLAEANGLVQAITIAAILGATFVFTALFEQIVGSNVATPSQILTAAAPLGWLLVAGSLLQVVALYRLAPDQPAQPAAQRQYKRALSARSTRQSLHRVARQPVLRLCIIGLATFWSVGQVLLATFPAYAKGALGVESTSALQGILAASGVGIALGSMLASRFSKNRLETGLIPIGALGMALGLTCLPFITSPLVQAINFVFLGTMGGLFIVVLNALIQFHVEERELGSVLAASNAFQHLTMLGFLIVTALMALAGLDSRYLLALIAAVALLGGAYTLVKLPQSLVRFVLSFLLTRHYRVSVHGLENLPSQGGVLLLGNHISWIDWAMVQIACPRPVRFVMLKSVYERWYLRGFLKALGCIPIERGENAEKALEAVAAQLNAGEVVCLFPEGAISRTGQLGAFRRGYQRACEKANPDVVIVPFYLRGLWGSQFSRSSERLKTLRKAPLHRSIVVAFGEALAKNTPADVLKRRIFDQATRSWHYALEDLDTLGDAWIKSVKRRPKEPAMIDTARRSLSARQALGKSFMLARWLAPLSPQAPLGLLLPLSIEGVLTTMAALTANKTPVHLDAEADDVFKAVLARANITTIVTSRAFIAHLDSRGVDVTARLAGRQVVYLEDLTPGRGERIKTALAIRCLPAAVLIGLYSRARRPSATAAIVFTGDTPERLKGVKLSHRNLMANVKQLSDALNTEQGDAIMTTLAPFNAYGLTATQLLPLIEGLPLVCHEEPDDSVGVARALARYQVSVLCTDAAFLKRLAQSDDVHPLMLDSLRVVVAGGEPVDDELRDAFERKFRKLIFEGYGVTEAAPVATVNLPDALDVNYLQVQRGARVGSVGMPLPGTSIKIVDVNSFQEKPTDTVGRILISGPQVMQGYLNDEARTAKALKEIDGDTWLVTDDDGYLDADGFLTLTNIASLDR
ncbi:MULTISPECIES: MFS transporter [unclassified Halomonas]|uniref:MFS transporter n=1 Tax=unclassified Halomonas TaxID=2609666 RepID=UPI0020769B44|nr:MULTISPECIES: MFS transporter [unclassified Halomonas]